MAETAEAPAAAPVAKKSKTAAKPKKTKTSSSHPKVSQMVNSAIASLKERGGSSLQAIKKHIASTHNVDAEKLSPFIKKYLKNAVASGTLVQTKGKGANGSFRMNTTSGKSNPAKKSPDVKKPKTGGAQKPAKKSPKPKAAKITKKAKVVKPKTPKPKKAKKTPIKKAPARKPTKK